MLNQEIQISRDYAEAVFRRATTPMEPLNFSPNWADQPSRYKIYRQVERFSLPTRPPASLASMADILRSYQDVPLEARALAFEELATILQFSHGVLHRRLGINWNQDDLERARYCQAIYGRGTASGGGMYPTEIYWACGQSGPLLPGLYHYDNAHHALARLVTGDVTQQIRDAVFAHSAAMATDQFLFITLNFWKNSFKYNTFCYHVVTQDLGALLGSLRCLALGFEADLPVLFWYQDEELNRLLGLDTLSESVFAVLPIPAGAPAAGKSGFLRQESFTVPQHSSPILKTDSPLVAKESFQRSQKQLRFPLIEHVHQAALLQDECRPEVQAAFKAGFGVLPSGGEAVELPAPALDLLQKDVLTVIKKRRSSFGYFSSHVPLSLVELATLLHFGSSACGYVTDLKREDGKPRITRMFVFANNVEELERGAYAYDPDAHCLRTVRQGDMTSFLQSYYFLQNYNLVETGAVIAIVGSLDRMLETYGNRGYRILNAEVGLVAQNIYLASTALSSGCGAALGFDNIALNKALGLEGSDQRTLLFLLIGHERQGYAEFNAQLV